MITQVIQPHGALKEGSDSLVKVGGGEEETGRTCRSQESELVSVCSDLTA